MSDLPYVDRTQEVKIAGQDATGLGVNYVAADANGNMNVRDYSNGSVTPGTVASVSSLIGGQFNTSLPTLTNTQQSAIQLDSSGRLMIRLLTSTDVVSAVQSGAWTTGRTWTLASGTDSVSAVQSGTWNINNISGTISLPTGAATSALQTTGNTSLSSIVTNTNSLILAQGSTTSGQTGNLAMGAVTTAAPTYATGQTNPVSLTTAGALRVDGSGSTQPISGTVTANQGTSPWVTKDQADGPVAPGTAAAFSELIGGQFNTALPTLTNTQQSAIQLDSSGRVIIRPLTSADVVSAVQSGAWTTGRTWTLASGTDSVSAVQSGTWNVNSAFVDVAPATQNITAFDAASTSLVGANSQTFYVGTPTAGSAVVFAVSSIATATIQVSLLGAGGTIVVEVSMDGGTLWLRPNVYQVSTQSYTNGFTAPFMAVVNLAGMTHVRVRGITSWTGTATVLVRETLNQRVITIADSLPSGANVIGGVTQSGTWTVQQGTPPWTVQGDSASGAAKAGNPVQVGGVFNTTQPTVTNGQTVEAQSTARGALIVATGVDSFNINNVTGTVSLPTGAATSANQTTEITSLQLIDNPVGPVAPGTAGTNSFLIGGVFNTALPTLTNTQQAAIQLDSSGRLIIAPLASTSTVTANQGAANTSANGWPVKITDGTDNALVTTNGDQKVSDGLRNGGVYGALNIPTANTPVEAKVGASRLTNRKFLQIVIQNTNIWYGLDNAVTTTSGTPTSNGQIIQFSIDPDSTFQIWLVGNANNKNVQITECP